MADTPRAAITGRAAGKCAEERALGQKGRSRGRSSVGVLRVDGPRGLAWGDQCNTKCRTEKPGAFPRRFAAQAASGSSAWRAAPIVQ
jgi:hypothetical protein